MGAKHEAFLQRVVHVPTAACWPVHCSSHNVDEWHPDPYIVCGECGHVYASKRALRSAYRRKLRDLNVSLRDFSLQEWWRYLIPPRASRIFFCQECSHDF